MVIIDEKDSRLTAPQHKMLKYFYCHPFFQEIRFLSVSCGTKGLQQYIPIYCLNFCPGKLLLKLLSLC